MSCKCAADPPTLAAASFEGAQAASSWAAGCHKDTGTRAGVWYGVGARETGGLLLEREAANSVVAGGMRAWQQHEIGW